MQCKAGKIIWIMLFEGSFAIGLLFNQAVTFGFDEHQLLNNKISALFKSEMERRSIPGAAIVIVKDGEIICKQGFGFSNLSTKRKVDPDSTVFRIGSISKTMTVIAALKLVEEGRLKLDADVNEYLSQFQVESEYGSIQLAHLLSHSAGLDEVEGSRQAQSQETLIPLAEFLDNRLHPIRSPGEIPAYSTYGIALAGHIVEEKVGSLDAYLRKAVWVPCGMEKTAIDRNSFAEADLAVGYELINGTNLPQRWEWYHTFPASCVNSSPLDMSKYLQCLLDGGQSANGEVLTKSTVDRMFSRQISGHPQISGFGFGFFENVWYGQTTWEHGGDMAGFSSYVVIDPQNKLGVFVVHHHEGSNLRYQAIDTIYEHFFGETYKPSKPGEPQEDFYEQRAESFTGRYRWLSNSSSSNERDAVIWSISANEDDTLSLNGRKFVEVRENYFVSTDGANRLAFRRDQEGEVRYMFLGNVDAFEKIH